MNPHYLDRDLQARLLHLERKDNRNAMWLWRIIAAMGWITALAVTIVRWK